MNDSPLGVSNARAAEVTRVLARQLYRRLQARPFEKRRRPLRMRLTSKSIPLMYECPFEETQKAWVGVEALVASGWVTVKFNSAIDRVTSPPWREPTLEIAEGSLSVLHGLADLAKIPRSTSFETRVLTELVRQEVLAHEELEGLWSVKLSGFEIYSPDDVARRLGELVDLARSEPELYLREASARLFNGNSKLLDDRQDLISVLTGRACPWQEAPVQLNVGLPSAETIRELVFIENLTTFERMVADKHNHPYTGFIYCAGWKGAAERAATRAGRALYFNTPPEPDLQRRIEETLENYGALLPLYFYGDLDFSGMGILASLRKTYPTIQAWRPGYWELMLRLQRGQSHAPREAEKQKQLDPGRTGCIFADTLLLPALRKEGRFVDQESV